MTKLVGLTGGIGSGKTTVAALFSAMGVPIYNSDTAAKRLMNTSSQIKTELQELVGAEVYDTQGLNKTFLASKLFEDQSLLSQVNAIVHPRVAKDFESWFTQQQTPYAIKEVAILFELESESNFDAIITVTATEQERIERVIERDGKTSEMIKKIIAHQLPESYKIENADYVIHNTLLDELPQKVEDIHRQILKQIVNKK